MLLREYVDELCNKCGKNNIIKNMYSIVSCLVILGGCCIVSMLQNKKYVFDSKLFGYTWRMLYSIYVTMRYNRNYVNRDNMNGVETLLGLCSNTDIRK